MSENTPIDKKDLFIQALQERMAQLVVEYETKNAELRVEFTLVSQERDQLREALVELRESEDAVQATDSQAD